jgi:hypothetical protein
MSKPRDPKANNSMATARVSPDNTKAELRDLAAKSRMMLLEITRKVIIEGLPTLKRKLVIK